MSWLQEYLRQHLIDLASRPDPAALMERIRERKRRTGTRFTSEEILALRDADRP